MFQQFTITLKPKARGFHLITDEVTSQITTLADTRIGILHLFIQHTSASITINENADVTVRQDLEAFLNRYVPENEPYFKHDYEGADDMPAHIKASLLGNNLSIPINHGNLNMGIWQGIYLGEHRNHAGSRKIIATIMGD